jgi:dUTP pyrophosphatase
MIVLVQKLVADVPLPSFAHPGDAGADLVSTVDLIIEPGERALVPTGISIALPENSVAYVMPRSGLAIKHGVTVLNAPGTIDSGYRGEIKVPLINLDPKNSFVINRLDRIAQ